MTIATDLRRSASGARILGKFLHKFRQDPALASQWMTLAHTYIVIRILSYIASICHSCALGQLAAISGFDSSFASQCIRAKLNTHTHTKGYTRGGAITHAKMTSELRALIKELAPGSVKKLCSTS